MTKGSRKSAPKKSTRTTKTRFRTVEFEGEKFKIAVVKKASDIPVQQKIKIAELVCLMYQTDRFTLSECLEFCGILSDVTWYTWKKSIQEIEVLYQEAKILKDSIYKHRLKERARNMSERLIEGYTVEVQERIEEPISEKKGNRIVTTMQVTQIKTKQVHIRPSVKLIESTLYNFDGDNYVRNPEPYQAGNEKIPSEIKIEIVGGSMKPVTSEEDIDQDI